jgi:spermidine/putrescine transport system permease protein
MMAKSNSLSKAMSIALVALTYIFLYLPVLVMVLFSFNESDVSMKWTGFSLKWYGKLWSNPEIVSAFKVSLIVAFSSMILSLILSTCLVIASSWWRSSAVYALFYPNVVLPDIAIAVSILSLFIAFRIPLGYTSLIVGHTLIGLGFAIPIIRARFSEIDPFLTEASLDLGASYFRTIVKVILPLLKPSLIASGLIVFTLSLDDFLIAFFCSGSHVETLSMYVYSQLKTMVDPSVNAISACFLLLSSCMAIALCTFKLIDRVVIDE